MKMKNTNTPAHTYSFYSNVLKQPFASVEELAKAEDAYFEKQKAKEAATNQKKADAKTVEDAFKALNTARKAYRDDLAQLTTEYAESLENLKKAFDLGKKDIANHLAEAEKNYNDALKAFTDKYPEGYHLTLKDGDFETTVSKQTSGDMKTSADFSKIADLFDLMFRF